jgi:hypothetical protein
MNTPLQGLSSLKDLPQRLSSLKDLPQRLSSLKDLPQRLSSLKDLPQGLSSLKDLPKEILHIIFKYIQYESITLLLVCKHWQTTILEQSTICITCKKVTKIYDSEIWKTYTDDGMCHGYIGNDLGYGYKRYMIDKNPLVLQKFKHPTKALCKYAIKRDIRSIELVKHIASKLPVNYLESILNLTNIMGLVKNNGLYLKYVLQENQTEELCILAIKACSFKNLPKLLPYIKIWTEKILMELAYRDVEIVNSLDYEFTF